MTKPPAAKPATTAANRKKGVNGPTTSAIVVTTTTSSLQEAQYIAEVLVRGRLAACVQMTPITTKYMWKGEIAHHEEVMLTIKTLHALYPKVQAAILKSCTYDLPEVIAQPVVGCSKAYFDWIVNQVTQA